MTTFRKLVLLGMLAPAMSISAVHAVEPGFYLGGSFGQTTVDRDAGDYGLNDADRFEIDGDDTGWKAYLGYNFTRWIGVEAGYVDFGGISDSFAGRNVDLDITGYDGFLVGTLPLGPVDLFAKAGAINFQADVNFGNVNEDDNEVEFAYGVGLAYNIGHWSLRAEAEGFDDNEVDDFYFLSAGVTYRFGGDEEPEPVAAAPAPAPAPAPAEQCADADGDNVCDADDICPGTPIGATVDAIGCNCNYTLTLEFAFDSADLSPNDMAKLDEIVPVLTHPKAAGMRGTVSGHTDSVGSETYNQGLSERRAASVRDYLVSRGVNGGNFTTNGYGESQPVAGNDTEEGRAMNRRIELRRTDCGN